MVHAENHGPRSSTVKGIDPALTLGEDIAKFVIDWTHINGIKKIDSIRVDLHGTSISAGDLEQLLSSLLSDVTSKGSDISVGSQAVKHICHEHHVTHDREKCHICGKNILHEMPRIRIQLKAKDRKAEIHL